MNSALFARPNSLFTYQDPNNVTNFTGLEGYLVADNAGALTVSASATVPAVAVVLDGLPPGRPTSMGTLGKTPPVRLRAGGTISQFSRLAQNAAGQVISDPGPGTARVIVGLALEAAVAGDYFLADPCFPTIAS
jgi:hypothetical protein